MVLIIYIIKFDVLDIKVVEENVLYINVWICL